jgi:DNA repair protein RadD
VTAEHLDGDTPKRIRDEILGRLGSGETTVVCNCAVLTEGWDMPSIKCCILARPTKKLGLYRQMVGRVLRADNGKDKAIIIDHAGAVHMHGSPADDIEWTLDIGRKATNAAHQKRVKAVAGGDKEKMGALLDCTKCGALRMGGQPCPNCGHLPKRPAEYVPTRDGKLGLVSPATGTAGKLKEDKGQVLAMMLRIRERKNANRERLGKPPIKRAWAYLKTGEYCNCYPPWQMDPDPIEPSFILEAWVKSRDIAWFHAQQKQRQQEGRQT